MSRSFHLNDWEHGASKGSGEGVKLNSLLGAYKTSTFWNFPRELRRRLTEVKHHPFVWGRNMEKDVGWDLLWGPAKPPACRWGGQTPPPRTPASSGCAGTLPESAVIRHKRDIIKGISLGIAENMVHNSAWCLFLNFAGVALTKALNIVQPFHRWGKEARSAEGSCRQPEELWYNPGSGITLPCFITLHHCLLKHPRWLFKNNHSPRWVTSALIFFF